MPEAKCPRDLNDRTKKKKKNLKKKKKNSFQLLSCYTHRSMPNPNPATKANRYRDPQPNIRRSLGDPREEGKEGL